MSSRNISSRLKTAANQNVKEKEYWLEKMSGELIKSAFPYDSKIECGHHSYINPHPPKITFSRDTNLQLLALSNGSDEALHMILLAALILLLGKYTGRKDIIVGIPIYYDENNNGELLNTVLPIRTEITDDKTFKELLLKIKTTVIEAEENLNYPMEVLADQLNLTSWEDEFPLFDLALLLENVHQKKYLQHINLNMTLSFLRIDDYIEGKIEYNASLYKKSTIERIIRHFIQLLEAVLFNLELVFHKIDILSGDEKRQLLLDFNNTESAYSQEKAIHELFVDQAKRSPDHIAVIGTGTGVKPSGHRIQLSYRELNATSNHLAALFRKKGIKPDEIVGLMMGRSPEMISGIMAILKAGAAYLPIEPRYPVDRIEYAFKDSGINLLLTQSKIEKAIPFKGEIIHPDNPHIYRENQTHLKTTTTLDNLAYIIYTSGSTGRPKGVMVDHRNLLAYIHAFYQEFRVTSGDIFLQQASFAFDAFVEEIYPVLLAGGRIAIPSGDEILDIQLLSEFVAVHNVTVITCSPLLLNELNKCTGLNTVHTFINGGDVLKGEYIDQLLKRGKVVYNTYGPTEATVCVTYFQCSDSFQSSIPIGKPISNYQAYILDENDKPVPIGVTGELCVSGDGVTRGYLNKPELTHEKFKIKNRRGVLRADLNAGGETHSLKARLYRTGDLTRWLEDGNIEFLGRVDQQVKIRGYRIELGEIESQLLTHHRIKEAVAVIREDKTGDNYICAYIVLDYPGLSDSTDFPTISQLREYLEKKVPTYMIPSYFVQVEKIPQTLNGKLDRKALPQPEIVPTSIYAGPGDEVEEKLVEIWMEILGIDALPGSPSPGSLHGASISIGIDDNFFELGGHSLKALTLLSKVHKILQAKVPLAQLFKTPTIRSLANYIKGTVKHRYLPIRPVEKQDYYTLSSAQKRLYILQQMELESTLYNIPKLIPMAKEPDIKKLEDIFTRLIQRHESLRTSFHMLENEPIQRIHDEVAFTIKYFDLIDADNKDGVHHSFIRPFDLSAAPLLKMDLVKMDSPGYLLLLDMHHIITDGISQEILTDEFMSLYEFKELPPLKLQYKDYAQWQNSQEQQDLIKEQKKYWLNIYSDEPPILHLPIDYPRPLLQRFEGNSVNFTLKETETQNLKNLAKENNATLFMVILSIFNILLSKLSGQEDIVVGTPIAARRHADLQSIIGMFVNTLALRSTLSEEMTTGEFLQQVKERTLQAFENQEFQFEDLVDQLAVSRDTGRNPLFDVMFNLLNQQEYTNRMTSAPADPDQDSYQHRPGTSKFDLTLTALDLGKKILLTIEYCSKLFRPTTIERIIEYFKTILYALSKKGTQKIWQIEMITHDEKHQLVYAFNDTTMDYPHHKLIHELFQEQVTGTPNHVAVVEDDIQFTYAELNKKTNQLAQGLHNRGLGPDTIVGIVVGRSLEMVIGILAILKAGAAYLPINPEYPQERIKYLLDDSKSELVLTHPNIIEELPLQCDIGDLKDPDLYREESKNLKQAANRSRDLAYTIYTSGSTGRPKGVMVEHQNVVRLVKNTNYFRFKQGEHLLQTGALEFDASTFEIWGTLLNGLQLVLAAKEIILAPDKLKEILCRFDISTIWMTAPLFNQMVDTDIEIFQPLKHLLVGGEALSPAHINQIKRRFPRLNIINGYGPTENTTFSTTFAIDREYETSIPIGGPIANSTVYILNKYRQVAPIGVPGELVVGGDGVARGYLNNPELTAQKFQITHKPGYYRSHRFYKTNILYQTGDLARWLPGGNIEFLGRIDDQVKIRGFRIELGEITNQLLDHEAIQDAVVIAKEPPTKSGTDKTISDKYLCAYVVSEKKLSTTEIKEYLAKRLPDYMIPSFFMPIDKIPLTSNGKVDRKQLPGPEIKPGGGYAAPRDTVEMKLVQLWADVLGIESDIISIDARFFELGGHSLKATILASKVHKALDIKLPLAEIFKTPTIRGLSRYIRAAAIDRYDSINPVEKKEYYLLSSAQKRLYILQQMEIDNIAYNMPQLIPLAQGSDTDKAGLEATFKKLITRHDSLRTSFEIVGGLAIQKINKEVTFNIDNYETEEKEAINIIKNFTRPFDLRAAPLLRVALIKNRSSRHMLLLDMHHIITDGISQEILTDEFMSLYEFKELPPLKLQYKDYAQWQNSRQQKGAIINQEKYWLQLYADDIPVLHLPTDYPRPPVQSFAGSSIGFKLTETQTRQLKNLAKGNNITLFMTLLSLFNILLARLSGQEDIVVGTPIAARRHADLEPIIGMFVNTLALRSTLPHEMTTLEFFQEVKEQTLQAFENQEYQFEDLVEQLPINRDAGRNPLFDVMFTLNQISSNDNGTDNVNTPRSSVVSAAKINTSETPQKNEKNRESNAMGISKFDLTLTGVELGPGLFFTFQYCTKLFKKETIERFSNYLKRIVSAVTNEPGLKLWQIQLLSGQEKHRLLFDFNKTGEEYPLDKTLHHWFEQQVGQTPHHIALVLEDQWLDYLELNRRANILALHLQKRGIGPNLTVGLMVERSLEMIIAVLGTLKAGGAYLPIDPGYPPQRIEFMLADTDTKLLLTLTHQTNPVNNKQESPGAGEEIKLDINNRWICYAGNNAEVPDEYHCKVPVKNKPSDLVYIIYTSGSTGRPKGVMIEHRHVVNLVFSQKTRFNITPQDRILQFSSLSFDASVEQIWIAFLSGAGLVLVSKELLLDREGFEKYIISHSVTHIHAVPSYLKDMKINHQYGYGLKRVIAGGDLCPVALAHRWYERCDFYNEYGPTETTVTSMMYRVKEINNDRGSVLIGGPIGNTTAYIVDRANQSVPIGVSGELTIGGAGVARGYLNRPELTAEKFNHDLWDLQDYHDGYHRSYRSYKSYIIYKTGDLARWLPDGNIEFLGRIDHQVKIRGYRIELGEIENQLVQMENIKEALVITKGDHPDQKYLWAYVVSQQKIDLSKVSAHLSKTLPDYMIPSQILQIDRIPLNYNGKIDWSSLPIPEIKADDNYAAPGNEIEEKLVEIWSEVLNIEKEVIGIDSSFFALGGHSLKATILVSMMEQSFGIRITLNQLFKKNTIRELSEMLMIAKLVDKEEHNTSDQEEEFVI